MIPTTMIINWTSETINDPPQLNVFSIAVVMVFLTAIQTLRHLLFPLSVFLFPAVLCRVSKKTQRLFFIHFDMNVGVIIVQRMFSQSFWWNFLLIVSSLLGYMISQRILCSSGLWECYLDWIIGTGLHPQAVWFVMIFCNGLYLLQKEVSLMRKTIMCRGLQCSLRLWKFNKMVVIYFFPITMTSPAWSCLCFQYHIWFLASWVGLKSN